MVTIRIFPDVPATIRTGKAIPGPTMAAIPVLIMAAPMKIAGKVARAGRAMAGGRVRNTGPVMWSTGFPVSIGKCPIAGRTTSFPVVIGIARKVRVTSWCSHPTGFA
ncbi:hypothetical protein Pfra02_01610 [Pseudomonas fragi]|nr:hypothetical protein Pfra02_01610 [Pseudomonas fragi]